MFWGKAAARSWEVWASSRLRAGLEPEREGGPVLVISPEPASARFLERARFSRAAWIQGEHPLPGAGSFAAGAALLDYFDEIRRARVRKFEVFLSGGASSLAWLPPVGLSETALHAELRELYARPFGIAELNRRRSRLCALKAGGAGRWLRRIAPSVSARVWLFSDVLPYGPEIVGSGPFFAPELGVPHRVLADNRTLVDAAVRYLRSERQTILGVRNAGSGAEPTSWQDWVERLSEELRLARARNRTGWILEGGEPRVALPTGSFAPGRGGRQTHLVLALVREFREEIVAGGLEILGAGSDGRDGRSGAAGAVVDSAIVRRLGDDRQLAAALAAFDSATPLARAGALLPPETTGNNLQDLLLIRIR